MLELGAPTSPEAREIPLLTPSILSRLLWGYGIALSDPIPKSPTFITLPDVGSVSVVVTSAVAAVPSPKPALPCAGVPVATLLPLTLKPSASSAAPAVAAYAQGCKLEIGRA